MRLIVLAAAATVLSGSVAAYADTFSSFNITGASVLYGLNNDTNTITGSTTIDLTKGIVESISFTAGGVYESGVDAQYGPSVFVGASDSSFTFTGASLIDFADGGTFNLNGPNDLYVGHVQFTPASSVTPEPSSVALLGTGLLGVAGVVKRRFAATPRSTPARQLAPFRLGPEIV